MNNQSMNSLDWLNSLDPDQTEELKLNFAKEIDDAIISSGLKRFEIANRIGTSPAWITKILRGDANPTLETMQKLANAVGCNLHISVVPKTVEKVVWVEVCGAIPPLTLSVSNTNQVATYDMIGKTAPFKSEAPYYFPPFLR